MKITLRTVAEAAGVSVATVDRVLNRRDGVRSVTIEKVESAIRQLGYAPSSLAGRVQPTTSHFAFVLPRGHNPFFEALDGNLAGYAAFPGPVLVVPGAEDRTIPTWVQKKLLSVFRAARWEPIEGSGHVVYLEKPDAFFGVLRRFLAAKSTSF